MTGISSIELNHCRELAILPGSLFELTSRFVRADRFESLLALYALRQAIGSVTHGSQDDTVKWAKLKWWSEELLEDPESPSRHPVLRALYQSGARSKLENSLLMRLISGAVMQIDASPDSDEMAMFERLSLLGSTEIEMELALEKAQVPPQNLRFLSAATSLFRMLSSFAPNHRSEIDRLPLNSLAKYDVSVTHLQQNLFPEKLVQIIAYLAGHGLDWFSQGLSGLKVSTSAGQCAHLRLRWAMENRQLQAIRKNSRDFIEAGKSCGPADAWFAWRFLRRLK